MLRRIDAVVPARDEAELIGSCLDALLAARAAVSLRRPALEVGITIVLDDCSDDSEMIVRRRLAGAGAGAGGAGAAAGAGGDADGTAGAGRLGDVAASTAVAGETSPTWGPDAVSGVEVLIVNVRNVGAARRAGVDAAMQHGAVRAEDRWIVNTDADSRVPEDWFEVQAAAFEAGVDVLLGTVRPDFDEFSELDVERWLSTHPAGHLPGNVHGANLGIRADRLQELGGFSVAPEHEDVDLVDRARAAGLRIVPTLDGVVATSGRRRGRTPGGYARFLADTYPLA